MSFCTAVCCMDGRVQLPVMTFLQDRFEEKFVDMITEPGINKLLANNPDGERTAAVLKRIDISINAHGSEKMAVIGHHDCAGNPVAREHQEHHTRAAVKFLKETFPDKEIIGLWADENFEIHEINL